MKQFAMLLLLIAASCIAGTEGKNAPGVEKSGRINIKTTVSNMQLWPFPQSPDMMYLDSYCIEPVVSEHTISFGVLGTDSVQSTSRLDTSYLLINVKNDSCYLFDKFGPDGKLLERRSILEKNQGQTGNRHPNPAWRYDTPVALPDTVLGNEKYMRKKLAKVIIQDHQKLPIEGVLYFRKMTTDFPDFTEVFWTGCQSKDALLGFDVEMPYIDLEGKLTKYRVGIWWELVPGGLNADEIEVFRQMIAKAER